MFSTRDLSATLLQTSGAIPEPRIFHCAVLINNNSLLICGGTSMYFGDQKLRNPDSVYLFNLVSREWSRVVVAGPGPNGRHAHTTTVVDSKLFVFGGHTGTELMNDMWTLDLNCLTSQPVWELYEPTPGNEKPLPRSGHISVTTKDCIIIFGGSDKQHYYNDTWSFDIPTRKWTEIQCTGSVPSPRAHHTAVIVDDVMYVFGGEARGIYFDDLVALQLSTQQWFNFHNVGPSPCRRTGHAMASDVTRVFVIGGFLETCLIHVFVPKDIKYPDPEPNAANPNVKSTQLAPQSSAGFPTKEQPQNPRMSLSEAHGASRLQDAAPAVPGLPASLQITHERNPSPNGQLSRPTGVNSKSIHVPEDVVGEGSTEPETQIEQQLAARVAQLTDEVADLQARLRDVQASLLSRDQQYEKEFAKMRAKFEANESEFRLRLADAEKGLAKSKAEAVALRAQAASSTGSVNRDKDRMSRIVLELLDRVRAIEAGAASKHWNEKIIESMECRNED